jgi:hypothetical protein
MSDYCTLRYSPWLHLKFAVTRKLVSIVTSSQPLLSSGFQRQIFLFLWFPGLSPCLRGLNCSNPLTAHQPTPFTPLYSTALQSLNWTRLVAWHSLGADYIENTTSNNTSIVTPACCLATVVFSLFVSCALTSNGSIYHRILNCTVMSN